MVLCNFIDNLYCIRVTIFRLHTKNFHIAAFIHIQMYFIDLLELLYCTFMCTLYVFDNRGEYGTSQW